MPLTRTVPLFELYIGDNVFHRGYLYTVTNVQISDDLTTTTINLGYPRKLDDDAEQVKEIIAHSSTKIDIWWNK